MIVQNSTDFTGQQFGNYELETLIKHRAVSDLYIARDVKLDQPVYIEVLRGSISEDPDLAGRFQRRMNTVAQIKKPNIAPVIETGVTDDGYAYAVIEYIQGVWMDEMLADWQEKEQLATVAEALALGRSIADGLSSGHSAGLIHHDLRPDNILISDFDGSPILLDFGVPVSTNLRNGVLIESRSDKLDYASPEELEGKTIGRRSNIYSLGIILYKLLTGHRPELPTSSWDIFEHATMPKEVPLEEAREGLSEETYRLVRNCLWRQEWSRFETADEVISAIDTAILAEQTVPKAAIWSEGRSRWLYVAVPILAGIVVVVGLVLLWSQFVSAGPQGAVPPVEAAEPEVQAEQPLETPAAGVEASVIPSPTILPTQTPTREPPPTSVMDTTVPIFGPSMDQLFARSELISFAWIWLNQPEPGEAFTIYVESEDEAMAPIAIGSIDEPDNASLYRLDTSATELELPAGSYLWRVRLEDINSGEAIVESDARRFIIAPEPTATPSATNVPPTSTASATASATAEPPTATLASPTATVACEPSRPAGWIAYNIQSGDTISLFASRANVTVDQILQVNCLRRGSVLSIGQLLYIPAPPATPTFTPLPTFTPGSNLPGGFPPPGGGDSGGGGDGGGGSGGGGGDNGGGGTEPTDEPQEQPTKTPLPNPEN